MTQIHQLCTRKDQEKKFRVCIIFSNEHDQPFLFAPPERHSHSKAKSKAVAGKPSSIPSHPKANSSTRSSTSAKHKAHPKSKHGAHPPKSKASSAIGKATKTSPRDGHSPRDGAHSTPPLSDTESLRGDKEPEIVELTVEEKVFQELEYESDLESGRAPVLSKEIVHPYKPPKPVVVVPIAIPIPTAEAKSAVKKMKKRLRSKSKSPSESARGKKGSKGSSKSPASSAKSTPRSAKGGKAKSKSKSKSPRGRGGGKKKSPRSSKSKSKSPEQPPKDLGPPPSYLAKETDYGISGLRFGKDRNSDPGTFDYEYVEPKLEGDVLAEKVAVLKELEGEKKKTSSRVKKGAKPKKKGGSKKSSSPRGRGRSKSKSKSPKGNTKTTPRKGSKGSKDSKGSKSRSPKSKSKSKSKAKAKAGHNNFHGRPMISAKQASHLRAQHHWKEAKHLVMQNNKSTINFPENFSQLMRAEIFNMHLETSKVLSDKVSREFADAKKKALKDAMDEQKRVLKDGHSTTKKP